MSDRLVAIVVLAVCGVLFWQSYAIRRPPFAAFESFDAATFPRLIIALLAIFAVALLLRGGGRLVPRLTHEGVRAWLSRYRLSLASLGLFALYAVLMTPIGWIASTTLYLVTMQLLILPRWRPRDLAVVVAGSLLFVVAVGAGFERFLHVVLPRPDLF